MKAQAVLDRDLPAEKKNQLVEQVEFIAEEVQLPPERRRGSVIKAAMASIRDVALKVTALTTAWNEVQEVLEPLV